MSEAARAGAAVPVEAPEKRASTVSPESHQRFTWFLLLRAAVTTLLLVAAALGEIASPLGHEAPWGWMVFALIALTYGLGLLWALLLQRGGAPQRLGALQIVADVALVTLLVHVDGSADSGFVALYLVLLVGAALVLARQAAYVAAVAIGLAYLAVAVDVRIELVPAWPSPIVMPTPPLGAYLFTIAKNLVLFVATFALSRRLAGEVEQAGKALVEQGARIAELAALHDDVVRSMTSGLLTVGEDGRVMTLNPAGEEILGRKAADLAGRPLALGLPEIAEVVTELSATEGRQRRGEVELSHPDGERRILGLGVAEVVAATGQRVGRMVNFQDLTELRRMQARIERTERLAAIGRLAAGIAHEIRNPLAAISGSIELLTPSVASDPDSRDLMAILTREVDRLNRLIADLLDFAGPRPPQVAPLEVGTTLREILRVVENDRRLNPTANRFQLDLDRSVWVDADPGQLRQVVLNLLLNAADATPGGEPVEMRAFAEGEHAVIEVRDHGPGIPEEVRARIFEPFFTTKASGTGLGLPTVHRIVEEHRGSIEIDQPPDGGTVFRVRLRRRESAEAGGT